MSDLAIDPANPATLYAGASGGVFKSTDGGDRWQAVYTGPPDEFGNVPAVSALAIDPANTATLYVSTDGSFVGDSSVLKSTDGGANWREVNAGLADEDGQVPFFGALAIDPANPATLYAGTGDGAFKSTDGAASWRAMNSGLTKSVDVLALAISPNNPTTIYAGALADGVFKSTDAGVSWRAMNSGLANTDILALPSTRPTPRSSMPARTKPASLRAPTAGRAGGRSTATPRAPPFRPSRSTRKTRRPSTRF